VSTLVRHIYVVDDEVMITESLALILRRKGFMVSTFNDSLEALEQMKTVPPDLLISDVMMPQLSGIDLAVETAKAIPQCRILLLSGHMLTASLVQAAGAAGHNFLVLQKPIHPDELLSEIERIKVHPQP
jgi:DNA-binding NtrC family response regulator